MGSPVLVANAVSTILAALSIILLVTAVLFVPAALRGWRMLALPLPTVQFDHTAHWHMPQSAAGLRLQILAGNAQPESDTDMLVEVEQPSTGIDRTPVAGHEAVMVRGQIRSGKLVLHVDPPATARTLAALLLELRDQTGQPPTIRFAWSDEEPQAQVARLMLYGTVDLVTTTRELLHRAEPDPRRRPCVQIR